MQRRIRDAFLRTLAGAEPLATTDMIIAQPMYESRMPAYRLAWRGLLPEQWPEARAAVTAPAA